MIFLGISPRYAREVLAAVTRIIGLLYLCSIVGCSTISYWMYGNPDFDIESVLRRTDFRWKTDTLSSLIFCYSEGSYAARYVDSMQSRAQRSYAAVLGKLKIRSYRDKIYVFPLDSRRLIERLIGLNDADGAAFPEKGVVCYLFNEHEKADGPHEFAHVVSENVWGKPASPERWIGEGLAVYCDGKWQGAALDSICRTLYKQGGLLPLKELIFRFADHSELITYPEAGCFVRFLWETYGIDAVKEIWKHGTMTIERVTGKDLKELQLEWNGWLLAPNTRRLGSGG